MKIFFATTNKSKWDLFKTWCSKIQDLEILTPYDIDKNLWPDIEEDGETLEDNAKLKAVGWSEVVPDTIILANDCGVAIPALGDNWRQEWTKRSTGEEGISDLDRIKTFLEITKELKGEDRKIQWSDAIALVRNGEVIGITARSYPKGYIIEELPDKPQIIPGAPLATVEYKPKFGKVYSELSEEEVHKHNGAVEKVFQTFISDLSKDL